MASLLENPLLRGPRSDPAAESLLHEADPLADEAVASLVSRTAIAPRSKRFWPACTGAIRLSTGCLSRCGGFSGRRPPRPAWACEAYLTAASKVFFDWGVLTVAAHICASLPETYLMPRTAKLLDLTRQLDADPTHVDRHATRAASTIRASRIRWSRFETGGAVSPLAAT